MNLPIILRREAEADVNEAFAWYEAQRVGLGDKFAAAIDETLKRIGENPQLYATSRRRSTQGLDETIPVRHLLSDSGGLHLVVAVFHASRNPDAWQVRA